ncbi:metastasis-associated in colon cancer protein 1-like [Brienomyrus brachyistius]|uniref:metastasis-associated in colon cancer protein 1-like n=1 Tax=Brienomyrus brachyistius TaxID=42636 RepID=UPI0020B317C1|nr:metastasis-associated in colon cancer protein 1-like [Brienomyrus brachyistius]
MYQTRTGFAGLTGMATGSLARSRSEGSLIDVEEGRSRRKSNISTGIYSLTQEANQSDWPTLRNDIRRTSSQSTNPFWREVSCSNPFLNDMRHAGVQGSSPPIILPTRKEDVLAASRDHDDDIFSTSSNDTSLSFRWGSMLGIAKGCSPRLWSKSFHMPGTFPRKEYHNEKASWSNSYSRFLNPDFELLKNDMDAYKMAWLSHRQLTRSCLDLGTMRRSPGWAQTQATDTQIICRFSHAGGSVYLPESDISAHIPESHVSPGELQEVALKAIFDPPPGLNGDLSTAVTPLLEVSLSNVGAKGGISLEMKVSGEVKCDPISQVMAEFVCLVSTHKEGPFQKIRSFYLYRNTLQVKLTELKPRLYLIAAIQAAAVQPPATSVWDFIERTLTIGIYGPKHIHPSFKIVCVVSCQCQTPLKLPFSNIKQSNASMPPLVLQLWGKHQFNPKGLKDLLIIPAVMNSRFEVVSTERVKRVNQTHLSLGQVVRFPFSVSKSGSGQMVPFKVSIYVKDPAGLPLAEFHVTSPKVAPRKWGKHQESMKPPIILEEATPQLCAFRNEPVTPPHYGVALKSVIRQPRVEYLLDYFKGDTMAILCGETVRSVGLLKVKEWYIGLLRGRVGLVHCKNVKIITREQVIDFSGAEVTTQMLLDNVAAPFRKLTYMYSAVQSLVMECAPSWRALGIALGYSSRSLEDMVQGRGAKSETERMTCVLDRLKEDCHEETIGKKFLHELAVGLLKVGCCGVVSRLAHNAVILSTAVQLGGRWRELEVHLAKLSGTQLSVYETPQWSKRRGVGCQATWKPAYDFLYPWGRCQGDRQREKIQDLQLALDRMRSPITREWREVTGALICMSCAGLLHASAFSETSVL